MARPTHAGPGGAGPDDDASAVVKELVSRLVAGRVEAGSEGVEPAAIGLGSRGTAVARAQGVARMTLCAWCGEELEFGEKCCALPAHDGPAGIGRFPSSRLCLMIEGSAGLARVRAEARQGFA